MIRHKIDFLFTNYSSPVYLRENRIIVRSKIYNTVVLNRTVMKCIVSQIFDRVTVLAILLSVLTVSTLAVTEKTYVIGVNLATNITSEQAVQYSIDQFDSMRGYEITRDWWNSLPKSLRTTKWDEVVSIELHVTGYSEYVYSDTFSEVLGLYSVYANMHSNTSIDFLIDTTDFAGALVREFTHGIGMKIMVSPTDSSNQYTSIPGSYGAVTANTLALTSILPYLRLEKAETIATLGVNDGIYQNELCEGAVTQSPPNGLRVVYHNDSMPFEWWTLGAINPDRAIVWNAALDTMRALKPDAVVICDYFGGEYALNYMRQYDWTPKSVIVAPMTGKYTDPSLGNYVVTPAQYNAAARYTAQPHFVDSAGYDALVMQKYGVHATSMMAQSTLTMMLLTNMLINAADNSTESLILALQTSQLDSFMGTVIFDVNSRQTRPSLVTQSMNDGKIVNVVGPPLAAAATLVYPMPAWSERVFAPKWGSSVEIAGTVIVAIGFAISIGWLIFLIYHWNHDVIRAASPLFCVTIIVGSMIVYGSVFTWMPNLVNSSICATRTWLLPIGFMIMFGALLAKTYRIHVLHNTKTLEVIRVTNLEVAVVVLIIVVIQAIISIMDITIPDLKAMVHVVDQYRISHNFWVCTFDTKLKILFGVNAGYGGLLLGWGSYLAYKVRTVPIAAFDESKVIGFSIYNTGIFAIIVIAIQLAVGNSNRNVTFMVTAICCFLGAAITTCFLFGAKVRAIYWPSTTSSRSGSSGTRYTSGGSSGSGNNRTVEALVAKNIELQDFIRKNGLVVPTKSKASASDHV